MKLRTQLEYISFFNESIEIMQKNVERIFLYEPDDQFQFLHEAAIIEYHDVLYTSWYNCPKKELQGYTPICGKRSYDKGKTWTELEILCEDVTEKILYCPPVYGICDDRL